MDWSLHSLVLDDLMDSLVSHVVLHTAAALITGCMYIVTCMWHNYHAIVTACVRILYMIYLVSNTVNSVWLHAS